VAVFAAGDVAAVPGDDKISSADELQAEAMSRGAMVEMKTARIKERRRDGEGHPGGQWMPTFRALWGRRPASRSMASAWAARGLLVFNDIALVGIGCRGGSRR
jgi:hypothetical protein